MIRSNRTRRATLKARTRTNRAANRINRRGNGSLQTHALAQGLTVRDAKSMVGTLRKTAKKLNITGTEHRVHAGRRMRTTHRYTPAQVAQICVVYRPRKPAFKAAAARLALAA
ncbi:hypothetical protein [Streptomyces sp. NPDC005953]|uniref:hypothetical protein n=1 Tax=Streptomyces sp. NPDC005953 TaxID=3156719 RepID=UPI0033D6F38D